MKTTRPASTPTAAADSTPAAAEAKAGEGCKRSDAPVTLPAPGGSPTSRTASTSPAADDRTGTAGAKPEEEPRGLTPAPLTRAAPYGIPAGPEVVTCASGPAAYPNPRPSQHDQEKTVEPNTEPGDQADYDARTEAIARTFAARGFRAVKVEEWSHAAVLEALRENRRRHANSPYTQQIGEVAAKVADEIAGLVDLPPRDVATVLLAAGGSVGTIALLHPLSGKTAAEILQFAADELDQRATRGETS